MKLIKKRLLTINVLNLFCLIFLCGCNKSVNYEEITDLSLKEEVASFVGVASKKEYEPVPGDYTQGYSFYNSLINGEINQNKRVYSYIYDFSIDKEDKEYYLIYLNKDIVNKLNEDNLSNELIINNYFLYLYNEEITNKNISTDFKLYKVDSVENISYSIDNYQIISVFESNEFYLKENLSTKETINEKKEYLSTIYLQFNDSKKVSLIEENDNYENEYLVTNYEDILSNTLVYDFAISNDLSSEYKIFKEIKSYENSEVISLKRYYFYNGETLDLLKDDLTEYSDIVDYFGEYKEEFLDSYVIDLSSINSSYSPYYSYFSLDKLKDYMH